MALLYISLAIAVFVAAIVYHYFYCPIPSEAREPGWKMMYLKGCFKLVGDISNVGERLGLGESRDISRRLVSTVLYYSNVNLFDKSVQAKEDIFDGVRVRIYRPMNATGKLPGLVYMHGGGWVSLSLDVYDRYLREIVKHSGVVAVSIDYRLAPEHPFPVPFEDCLNATIHFLKNADKYGVDKNRVGISGDSSGGNLAMAVSLKLARDQHLGLPSLKSAIYIYPAAQALDFKTPSYQTYFDPKGFQILPSTTMIEFWSLYALGNSDNVDLFFNNRHIPASLLKSKYGDLVDKKLLPKAYQDISTTDNLTSLTDKERKVADEMASIVTDPDYSPLLADNENFRKLPGSIYILTAEYDPLRDDGFFLAARLEKLGMSYTHKHWERIEHGFLLGNFYETTGMAVKEMSEFIKLTI